MTTKSFLIILALMALLLILPNVASAQRLPPHVFVGTATMDGATAADGTAVTAWVGGVQAAATTVSSGSYTILVDQGDQSFSGQTITFQIGGKDALETATWMQGGGDELNLTAISAAAGAVVNIDLGELNASGQSGTATLTEMGSMTLVELTLSAGALATELVHVHSGQCGDTLGEMVYPLTSFVGGSGASSTMIAATLAMLQDGNHAINSHDASDASNNTACGNIPGSAMAIEPAVVAMAPPATGVPGARGREGPAGANGPAGPTGEQGAAGATGPEGSAGPRGSASPTGPAGAAGNAGPTGAQGAGGATGTAGTEGDDGSSSALAIVGLILAIIAVVGVGGIIVLSRRS